MEGFFSRLRAVFGVLIVMALLGGAPAVANAGESPCGEKPSKCDCPPKEEPKSPCDGGLINVPELPIVGDVVEDLPVEVPELPIVGGVFAGK